MSKHRLQSVAFAIAALAVASLIAYLVFPPRKNATAEPAPVTASAAAGDAHAARRMKANRTVHLDAGAYRTLGLETAPAQSSTRPRQLRMSGTTAFNPDSLAHVHPRFAGEATEIKARLGQRVKKGETLAVVWSKDLGEKKSEYVDGLSQLRLDLDILERSRKLYIEGALPERQLLENERRVEGDRIAVARAERTLRSWGLTDADINELEDEANRIRQHAGVREPRQYERWARVVIKAPFDGTIVEKNVVPGELVDPTMNLFVIADLSRIDIWGYAYEDDLPDLHAGNVWMVRLKALPGKKFAGKIRVVGSVVDPTQHTATILGSIPNLEEKIKAGMFATATVEMPPRTDLVAVPTRAVIDVGEATVVYVQCPGQPDTFERREVHAEERQSSEAFLKSGVRVGDTVVSQGALELEKLYQAHQ